MSRDDRRYARFYYPEFIADYPDVYADDPAFATWMRLLVTAEQWWPMPVELPRSVRPRPLARLIERGLVTVTDGFYTVKGLDAERTRRRNAGRIGAAVRWDSDGNANASANAMPSTSTSTRTREIPPPPTSGGRRNDGTNPRAQGTAPRQNGHAPRDLGESPRQVKAAEKRDPTSLADLLAPVLARGDER